MLRHKRRKAVHELWLGGGNLIVMGGTLQSHFRHRLPPSAGARGPRMNLTFRLVLPGAVSE